MTRNIKEKIRTSRKWAQSWWLAVSGSSGGHDPQSVGTYLIAFPRNPSMLRKTWPNPCGNFFAGQ
jgi:hypothetical protein